MGLQHQREYNRRLSEQRSAEAINAAPKPTASELKAQIEAIPAKKPKKQRAAAKIEEGLKEALAVVRGEAEPYQTVTPAAKRGRPKTGAAKEKISIRLDQDVINGFRARGANWTSLINEALRKELGI